MESGPNSHFEKARHARKSARHGKSPRPCNGIKPNLPIR